MKRLRCGEELNSQSQQSEAPVVFDLMSTTDVFISHGVHISTFVDSLFISQGDSMMVDRTTAVAQPKAIKVRSAAKATARVKPVKPVSALNVDGSAVATVPAPKTTGRKLKVETRTRVYWAVFNSDLKRVALFEFDQKEAAEKRADKLTKTSGGPHFIQKIKAIVQA